MDTDTWHQIFRIKTEDINMSIKKSRRNMYLIIAICAVIVGAFSIKRICSDNDKKELIPVTDGHRYTAADF
jgi:hypothetical protein